MEDHKFSQMLGDDVGDPVWREGDWDADPDWEWRTAGEDSPEELYARPELWQPVLLRSLLALQSLQL